MRGPCKAARDKSVLIMIMVDLIISYITRAPKKRRKKKLNRMLRAEKQKLSDKKVDFLFWVVISLLGWQKTSISWGRRNFIISQWDLLALNIVHSKSEWYNWYFWTVLLPRLCLGREGAPGWVGDREGLSRTEGEAGRRRSRHLPRDSPKLLVQSRRTRYAHISPSCPADLEAGSNLGYPFFTSLELKENLRGEC